MDTNRRTGERLHVRYRGNVLALAEDGQGRMWVGTQRSGLFVVEGQQVQSFTPWNSAMRHRMVAASAVDQCDRVWAGTAEGLVCFAGGKSRLLTTDNSGLPSNTIRALAADREERPVDRNEQGRDRLSTNVVDRSAIKTS